MKKPKALFILPKYAKDDGSHYPYLYALVDSASKSLDSAIIFESGDSVPELKSVDKIEIQKIQHKPLNLLERSVLLVKYFLQGYTCVYVHYSYWSVYISKLIGFFFNAKIYYWNCEYYGKKPNKKLLSLAIGLSHKLITGSDLLANQYVKIFNLKKSKTQVVNNWVRAIPAKKHKFDSSRLNIVFIHHLSPRKGSRQIPGIIKQFTSRVPNSHFHIIGDGPDYQWLKKELSTNANSTLHGSLAHTKAVGFLKGSDLFIMPSLSEGFPRVILEAMLYKIPIVSTDVGNVSELVGLSQSIYLTKPGHVAEFVERMVQISLLKNKQKLIEENYIKAKHYNLKLASQQLVRLFSNE